MFKLFICNLINFFKILNAKQPVLKIYTIYTLLHLYVWFKHCSNEHQRVLYNQAE